MCETQKKWVSKVFAQFIVKKLLYAQLTDLFSSLDNTGNVGDEILTNSHSEEMYIFSYKLRYFSQSKMQKWIPSAELIPHHLSCPYQLQLGSFVRVER